MVILFVLFVFFVFVFACILRAWRQLQKYNQRPLDIKTFDGSDSPYHPSVLYFEEGWKGYKYWMAETPFPLYAKPYTDRYECPSIHVSNDGINWKFCSKSSFPLDDLTEEEIKNLDFFSDPCLLLVNDTLECWYRITKRDGKVKNHFKNITLCRKTTIDGINWGVRECLIDFSLDDVMQLDEEQMMLCPSVLYKDGEYILYYVFCEGTKRNVCLLKSEDAKNWSNMCFCCLLASDHKSECDIIPWHIAVSYIDNKYYLICYELGKGITLFMSDDGKNFVYKKQLLMPSQKLGSFYYSGLYQACLIKDDKYKLYFSADNRVHTFIGLMEGDSVETMKIVSPQEGVHCSLFGIIYLKYLLEKQHYGFIINNLWRQIKLRVKCALCCEK